MSVFVFTFSLVFFRNIFWGTPFFSFSFGWDSRFFVFLAFPSFPLFLDVPKVVSLSTTRTKKEKECNNPATKNGVLKKPTKKTKKTNKHKNVMSVNFQKATKKEKKKIPSTFRRPGKNKKQKNKNIYKKNDRPHAARRPRPGDRASREASRDRVEAPVRSVGRRLRPLCPSAQEGGCTVRGSHDSERVRGSHQNRMFFLLFFLFFPRRPQSSTFFFCFASPEFNVCLGVLLNICRFLFS